MNVIAFKMIIVKFDDYEMWNGKSSTREDLCDNILIGNNTWDFMGVALGVEVQTLELDWPEFGPWIQHLLSVRSLSSYYMFYVSTSSSLK